MIYPHVNYGLLVWGQEYNKITKMQKRAIRLITCSKYNAHTEPLLKALEILRVSDVLHLNGMQFNYDYTRKQLPPYFLTFDIIRQGEIHDHDTRQRDRIRVNRTRIKIISRAKLIPYRITSWYSAGEFQALQLIVLLSYGLTYWIVYLHVFVFWHMQFYISWYIISFFGFDFTS